MLKITSFPQIKKKFFFFFLVLKNSPPLQLPVTVYHFLVTRPMITMAPLCRHISSSGSMGSASGGSNSGVGSGRDQKGGSPTGSGSGGGDKKGGSNQLCCPKCGDPCTHVETFVCKYSHFLSLHWIHYSLPMKNLIVLLLFFFFVFLSENSNITCKDLRYFWSLAHYTDFIR